MLAVVGFLAGIAGWDAWILNRDRRGRSRTFWLTTFTGGIRWINRNHWRRLGLLVLLGGALYHLELEQELHERMCPAGKENPCL